MADAPAAATGEVSFNEDERKLLAHRKKAEQERVRQALTLQRANILAQRTSSPARRTALEAALKQIEDQLAALG